MLFVLFNAIVALIAYVTYSFNLIWLTGAIVIALLAFDYFVYYFNKHLLGGAGGLESDYEEYAKDCYPNCEPLKKESLCKD